MARTLNEVIASLPKPERTRIEARARKLIAEEMSLQELRKAVGKTQTVIASHAVQRPKCASGTETTLRRGAAWRARYARARGDCSSPPTDRCVVAR